MALDDTSGADVPAAAPAADALVDVPEDKRMIPSVGRIVHYQLTSYDAQEINRLRAQSKTLRQDPKALGGFAVVDAVGNGHSEGDIVPLLITRVWPPAAGGGATPDTSVNGQIFLDGPDSVWKTSVSQTTHRDGAPEFGRWFAPPRV